MSTLEQNRERLDAIERARGRFTLEKLKEWYSEAVKGAGMFHASHKTDKVKVEFFVESLDNVAPIVFIYFIKLFGTREVITHKAWYRKDLMKIDAIGLLDSIAFSDYETFLRVIA